MENFEISRQILYKPYLLLKNRGFAIKVSVNTTESAINVYTKA